jgi:hypothetical protein
MEFTVTVTTDIRLSEASTEVLSAVRQALADCLIDTKQDAGEMSPWLTGNNSRSINCDLGPGGDLGLDDLQGAVYSTSGYGGYLETGHMTSKGNMVAPRPYMFPAAEKNFTEEKMAERVTAHLGESA